MPPPVTGSMRVLIGCPISSNDPVDEVECRDWLSASLSGPVNAGLCAIQLTS